MNTSAYSNVNTLSLEAKISAILELHLIKYHIVVSYFEYRQAGNGLCRVPKYLELFMRKQTQCISLLQSSFSVQTKVTKYYKLTGVRIV